MGVLMGHPEKHQRSDETHHEDEERGKKGENFEHHREECRQGKHHHGHKKSQKKWIKHIPALLSVLVAVGVVAAVLCKWRCWRKNNVAAQCENDVKHVTVVEGVDNVAYTVPVLEKEEI